MVALVWVAACSQSHSKPWPLGFSAAGDVVEHRLECSHGAYAFGDLVRREFLEGVVREPLIPTTTQHPNVRNDGSGVMHEVARFSVLRDWGHLDIFAAGSGRCW